MPLKTSFKIDLTNFVKNPGPMQPKQTKNLLHYNTYLISPNKVVITQRSEGREFMLSDRFAPEFIYIVTQTVNRSFQNENDPRRKLSMFNTRLEARGRVHIMKALALLKGKVLSAS